MSEAVYKIKDLSEDEFNFITAFMKEIKNLISKISVMAQDERLAWYEKFQYPRPLNFEKKIDGTFSPLPLDGNDLGEMNPSIAMECAPFGKLDGWITKNSSTLTAGEYRLYYRYGDGSLYAVGYFTVAE